MECIFCKIARHKLSSETIYENENFFSVPDINPKTKGHSLVISKKHFDNILSLNSTLGSELVDCIKNTAMAVMKNTDAEGFNLINNNFEAAGQVVKHLHFHIVPRKKGDGLNILA